MQKLIFCLLVMMLSYSAQAQVKKFNWIAWAKVSPQVKAKLKLIKLDGNTTAYQEIASTLEMGGTASLAVIDLDGDGIDGYAIGYDGSVHCGALGCDFVVYEKNGKKRIDLVDQWQSIKPAKNGVISSKGKFVGLESVK